LLGFAGLYAWAQDEATGEETHSCAIITTAANELMAPIHDRMPVILDPEIEALWLDPSVTDAGIVLGCLEPYPAAVMEAYPVASLVSSVRNDGPDLVEPLVH
jgi:putative SOS response-associated peptidase YedK